MDAEVMRADEAAVILEKATVEVFSMMLGIELRMGPPSENADPFHRAEITGLVAFTGARIGYVALHLSRSDAERFTAAFLGLESPAELSADQIRDAVGELANMISGTVKDSIGSTEPIMLSLPTVMTSAQDSSIRVKAHFSILVPFDFDEGEFMVELVIQSPES